MNGGGGSVDYVVVEDTAVRLSTAKLLTGTFLLGSAAGFGLGYKTAASIYADDRDRRRVRRQAKLMVAALAAATAVVGIVFARLRFSRRD
jgi:F0F1-type ATP synthase membrane subunit c/vacuolar-type H+-ATPase subunit K